MQKVEVYISISGDYCAFHEISFNIEYDITNDINLGTYSLKKLEKWKYNDYEDIEKRDAYLIDGEYYVQW